MSTEGRIENAAANEIRLTDHAEERLQILVKEGSNALMDFEWLKPDLPPYYNHEKFNLGQRMFYNNVFAMMVAKLCGLIVLLAIPTILDVIIFTRQSGQPCKAFRRYVSTIFHTFVWYEKHPSKQMEFLDSLKIVRRKHCVAFRRSAEAGLRRASQLDMALAQFGFMGFTVLSGDQLGISCSRDEMNGVIHFWRVIGYMLGMEEKYNLCAGTIEETRALCRRVLDDIFLPSLAKRDENFNKMGRVLLEGLWPVNPHLDPQAFTAFTLHLASSSATNNNHSIEIDTSSMPTYSRIMLKLQIFVHKYLMPPSRWWSSLFRAFFNSQMRLAIFLTEYFPFLAYWHFGIKNSHVNIFRYHID